MKLKDYILDSVYRYPSLYASETYEDARSKVLNHLFLVNGNGIEWANTKDPSKGGYLVHPQFYKYRGEWERKIDKPYGREKFDMEWNDILGFAISNYLNNDYGELEDNFRRNSFDQISGYSDRVKECRLKSIADGSWVGGVREKPYDYYDQGWPFYDIEKGLQKLEFVKPDWLEGMIEIKEWALKFYLHPDKFHKDKDYPNGKTAADQFKEGIERRNEYKNWEEVLKAYELSEYIGVITDKDYSTLSFACLEKRRLQYVEGLQNALKVLKK